MKFLFYFLSFILILMSCTAPKETATPQPPEEAEENGLEEEVPCEVGLEIDWDLIHTELRLTPEWQDEAVAGEATLLLTPFAYAQDSLAIDALGMEIDTLELSIGQEAIQSSYKYDGRKLKIGLPKAVGPGDTVALFIRYTAHPSRLVDSGIAEDYSERGLFFINAEKRDSLLPQQIWTQGETQSNSAWFPTLDYPFHKSTFDISLKVDTSMVTLSNGELIYQVVEKGGKRTDYWKLEAPHATYLTAIAIGDWAVIEDEWRDSVPVHYYVEKEYAPFASRIFGQTPAMMEFYSQLLDYPYPWPKYSQVVVRQFVSGAMENTTATIHMEAIQHDARAHLDDTYEEYIAHELFHQWFGDLVTCRSWSQLALNESFATYGEYLWKRHRYGADTADLHLLQDEGAYMASSHFSDGPIIEYCYASPGDLFDQIRYQKGGLVLHMLRQELGDSIFFQALHNYLTEHAYGSVQIDDLRLAMERESGLELRWFFDQWFMEGSHPDLIIQQAEAEDGIKLIVEQAQAGQVYRLPFPIEITTDKGTTRFERRLNQRTDTFYFPIDGGLKLARIAPDRYLLAEKKIIKPMSQWVWQLENVKDFRGKYDALSALNEHFDTLSEDTALWIVQKALDEPFYFLRKEGLFMAISLSITAKQTVFPKIRLMAQQDPSALVRASALSVLRTAKDDQAAPIYRKALTDSSYHVVATAMEIIRKEDLIGDTAAYLASIKPLEKARSGEVLKEIAALYSEKGDAAYLPFFHRAPRYLSQGDAFFYLNYLEVLLVKQSPQVLLNELPFLQNLKLYFSKGSLAELSYNSMIASLNLHAEQLQKQNPNALTGAQWEALLQGLEAEPILITPND